MIGIVFLTLLAYAAILVQVPSSFFWGRICFTFPSSWWSVGKKGVGRWNLGCFWLFSFSRPFFLSFMLLLKYISKNGLRKPLDICGHYIIFGQLTLSRLPPFEAYLFPWLKAIVKYFLHSNLYLTGGKRKRRHSLNETLLHLHIDFHFAVLLWFCLGRLCKNCFFGRIRE